MLYLGYLEQEKKDTISEYLKLNNINNVFILSPKKFYFDSKYEFIEWNEIIQYRVYYRLLKDINSDTLIIVNECLCKQNRYDLTYNCIRLFLNQTKHKIIFQYLPIIDSKDDFMILFDFDTKSRYKRERYNKNLFNECEIKVKKIDIKLNRIEIETSDKVKKEYEKKKTELIDNIGLKDPHTIPRNLYLLGGKEKIKYINDNMNDESNKKWYIGRNNRFKLLNYQTYKDTEFTNKYTIFEFCHSFLNFIDFLHLSNQSVLDVLLVDLKIDRWYFERYTNWIKEIEDVYTDI